MKKYFSKSTLCFLVAVLFLTVSALVSCKKSSSGMQIVGSNGKSKIELSVKEISADPNQEIHISGKDFDSGTIPPDSIQVGNKKSMHSEITIANDGTFPKTPLKLKGIPDVGLQDLQISGIQFAKAIQVNPIQIEYMMWGLPSELDTVNKYIGEFEKKYPNIDVKILHVPQMYDDKLKTLFAAKTPPDVMYMGLERFPSFVSRGVFLNLQPYADRDNKEFRKEDFYPSLMELFKYKGNLFGIPKDFTPLALYYNKDLFDKAGVKYPTESWTWKDFLDAARKLTQDFDKDGKTEYGFILETWFGQWFPWVWQNGGEIMDKTNTKWLLADPAYIDKNAEAIQFFSDLIWKEKVAPTPAASGDFGSKDMFMTGKVAMCTFGRWMCMDFKDIKDFRWDVQILPMKSKRASTLFTVCYSIAAQTKHPEESWQLVKFLTGTEGQIAVAESGLAIPARKSIATTKHFLEAGVITQKINAQAYLKQVEYSRPAPTNPHWVEVNEELGRTMELVFTTPADRKEKLTAKEAILKMQKEIETILSKPVEETEVVKK